MNFKWILLALTFLSIQLTLTVASTKRKKSEEEAKENSINYLFNELMTSPKATLTTMLHDATLPVFLVMGIASVASMMTGSVSVLSFIHNRCHYSKSS